jgi:hypothetical protein
MSWDFFTSRTVKGRKPYTCDECAAPIAKGQRHVYCAGKCEGELDDYRLCLECDRITRAYNLRYDPDDGYPRGETRAELLSDGIADPVAWANEVLAARAVVLAERRAAELAANAPKGWVVTDAAQTLFRAWDSMGSCWVDDPAEAVYYARRKDAESAHAEDLDAWHIVERTLPAEA